MTHTFKPGDRIVIVKSPIPERVGQIATVTSGLRPLVPRENGWTTLPPGTPLHDLDLPSRHVGNVVAYPPEFLRPYRESWDKATDVDSWIGDLIRNKESV